MCRGHIIEEEEIKEKIFKCIVWMIFVLVGYFLGCYLFYDVNRCLEGGILGALTASILGWGTVELLFHKLK